MRDDYEEISIGLELDVIDWFFAIVVAGVLLPILPEIQFSILAAYCEMSGPVLEGVAVHRSYVLAYRPDVDQFMVVKCKCVHFRLLPRHVS